MPPCLRSLWSRKLIAWGVVFVLVPAFILAGCDDESLMPVEADAGSLFSRYVALGNSITAGFQSEGINATTQQQAYPVLLAEAMGTPFNVPFLNDPGCPPPVENVFTRERVGGPDAPECALRQTPIPPVLNSVAVPGAGVIDVLQIVGPETSSNPLTTFLLGGRSQVDAAAEAQPTFVSVWIGNNDVLDAALSGNPATITPAADFEARYTALLDRLEAMGVQGGVLIGVANVALIPHLSPGGAYAQAKQAGDLPETFNVAPNCAGDGAASLVPFGHGFGTLLTQVQQGQTVTLDCLADAPVLTPPETAQVVAAVQAFNGVIQNQADQRGWAYVNLNPTLQQLKDAGDIPDFPNVPPAPEAVTMPFGPFFSKDGVHPNGATHTLVANEVVEAVNAHYGTNIPPVEGR